MPWCCCQKRCEHVRLGSDVGFGPCAAKLEASCPELQAQELELQRATARPDSYSRLSEGTQMAIGYCRLHSTGLKVEL
jgi:hypothetical protein